MAKYDDEDDDVNVRRPRRGGGEQIPNYLTQAILVTLCCCLPFGIVAIISATKVNELVAKGEYEQAMKASEDAKKWCWIGFGLGLVGSVIGVGLQIMAAIATGIK